MSKGDKTYLGSLSSAFVTIKPEGQPNVLGSGTELKKILRLERGQMRVLNEIKSENLLPKIFAQVENGSLHQQLVKCGKSGCRCSRGQLHGGYFYLYTRIDKKLRKYYVPKASVAHFALLVNQAARRRKERRRSVQESNKLLKELRHRLREYR